MIIETYHPTGYVTRTEIDLSDMDAIPDFDDRVKRKIKVVNQVIDKLNRKKGTTTILKFKSKANENA